MSKIIHQFNAGIARRLSLALIGIILTMLVLLFTTRGAPLSFKFLKYLSAGIISAEGVHGSLFDTLDVDRFTYKKSRTEVIITKLHLTWQPRELLKKHLRVQELFAEKVTVIIHTGKQKPYVPLPTKLPFGLDVAVAQFKVQQFDLYRANTAAELHHQLNLFNISAIAHWDAKGIHVKTARVDHKTWGVIAASGLLKFDGDAIHFKPLAVDGIATGLISGYWGLNHRASALFVDAKELHWPLIGTPRIRATQAKAHFTGDYDNADYALSAQLAAVLSKTQNPSKQKNTLLAKNLGAAFIAKGHLSSSAVTLKQFSLAAVNPQQGSVAGSGSVAWHPKLDIQAHLNLTQLNPAILLPEWPGRLNGKAEVNTVWPNHTANVQFSTLLNRSVLRGRNFALNSKGQYIAAHPNQLRFDQFELDSGGAHIVAQGQILPSWQATAKIDANNLNDLHPDLTGTSHADLKLQGELKLPAVSGNADLKNIKFHNVSIASAKLNAQMDAGQSTNANLAAKNVRVGNRIINSLDAVLEGSFASNRLRLNLNAPEGNAQLSFAGSMDAKNKSWSGLLQTASIEASRAPKLILQTPSPLQVSSTQQTLKNACFSAEQAHACINAHHAAEASAIDFDVQHFSTRSLQPFLPKDILIDSIADGKGSVRLNNQGISQANVEVDFSAGRIVLPKIAPLQLKNAHLSVIPQNDLWAATLTAETDKGQAHLSLNMPRSGAGFSSRNLDGKLALTVPSISFLQGYIPSTKELMGNVEGTILIAGTLNTPRFAGSMNLHDGSLYIPQLGISLSKVNTVISGTENGALDITGQAQSGDGIIKLKGSATTTSAGGIQAKINARGDTVQVVNLPDYRVWISPDIDFSYSEKQASLTGKVFIPKATITPRKLTGETIINPSRDVVVLGRESPKTSQAPSINTNVTIALGDAVRFEGMGLKARITGEVQATDTPGQAVTRGRGELNVADGHYTAYGQELAIETGRLLFAGGPLTEPTIDFKATRKMQDDMSVSVLVRGTLAAPMLDLTSSPVMTREEQLSWLVLGCPLANTSSAERSQVGAAALSLGLSGGELIAGRIGKTLGFDEVSIGSQPGDNVNQARLTIGKYLSPRLYVSYGVGLFERNNLFRLLYDLGHGFKLRTETGLNSGGDLIYTVDR